MRPDKPSIVEAPSSKRHEPATTSIVNRGLPTRLNIPRLGIDALITYVGINEDGEMKAPGDITEVGWYKYGPLPGNTGSAVLAGHVNGPNGRPGVFSKLNTLQVGDEFTVIDSTQQDTKFVVRATRTYSQDEQPIEVFADQVGARLNLITCTGSWDKEQRRYSERLVVFTEAIQ